MQGESLFNDGIGTVLFTILLLFATGGAGERTTIVAIGELLLVEAGGGLLLGIVTGPCVVSTTTPSRSSFHWLW